MNDDFAIVELKLLKDICRFQALGFNFYSDFKHWRAPSSKLSLVGIFIILIIDPRGQAWYSNVMD